MKEIIDKYIRKHIQIKGNTLYVPDVYFSRFNKQVEDVFTLKRFSINRWAMNNVSNEYVLIDADGDCYWYMGLKIHREDGPAVIRYDGKIKYYFLNDNGYTKEDYYERINR